MTGRFKTTAALCCALSIGVAVLSPAHSFGQEDRQYGPDIKYAHSVDHSTGQDMSSVIAGEYEDQFGPSWTCWWHNHLDVAIDIRDISTGIPDRVSESGGLPSLEWSFDGGKLTGTSTLETEIQGVTYYLPNDRRSEFAQAARASDSLRLELFSPAGEFIVASNFNLSGLNEALSQLPCFEAD